MLRCNSTVSFKNTKLSKRCYRRSSIHGAIASTKLHHKAQGAAHDQQIQRVSMQQPRQQRHVDPPVDTNTTVGKSSRPFGRWPIEFIDCANSVARVTCTSEHKCVKPSQPTYNHQRDRATAELTLDDNEQCFRPDFCANSNG